MNNLHATVLTEASVGSRFELTCGGKRIYTSNDASIEDGLLGYVCELHAEVAALREVAKETLLMLESRGMPDKFCDPIRTVLAESGVKLEDR